jgi:hypothetical protein
MDIFSHQWERILEIEKMSVLFGKWYEFFDENSKKNYYYNSETKETTWVKPTEKPSELDSEVTNSDNDKKELEKLKIEYQLLEKNNEFQMNIQKEFYENQIQNLQKKLKTLENSQFHEKSEAEYIQEIKKLNIVILKLKQEQQFHSKSEQEYIHEIENLKEQLNQQSFKTKLAEQFKSNSMIDIPDVDHAQKQEILKTQISQLQNDLIKTEENQPPVEEEITQHVDHGELPKVHQFFDHLGALRIYVLEKGKPKYLVDERPEEEKIISHNWLELFDEKSNSKFYYNTNSHKCAWDKPEEMNEIDISRLSYPPKASVIKTILKNQRFSHPPNYHEEIKKVESEEDVEDKEEKEKEIKKNQSFSKRKSFFESFFKKHNNK